MDPQLQHLLHLYGEGPVEADSADPEESAALAEALLWLEKRPRVQPDALVLDAVFHAAAHRTGPVVPGARHDRLPVRQRRHRRAGWLVGIACAFTLGVLVMPVLPDPVPQTAATEVVTGVPESLASASSAERAEMEIIVPESPAAVTVVTKVPAAVLAWDGGDQRRELDDVRARAMALKSRLDSLIWDAPAQGLQLPPPSTGGRYSQASSGQ